MNDEELLEIMRDNQIAYVEFGTYYYSDEMHALTPTYEPWNAHARIV